MDPNATLTEMRLLARNILAAIDAQSANLDGLSYVADELATATQSLDEWISKGGFLPTEWSKGQ